MINPFGTGPLLASVAGPGTPRGYSGATPAGKRQCGVPPERRPANLRKPISGEALIDNDGVVWLVESVLDQGDSGSYLTTVTRITRSEGDEDLAALPNLTREEFVTFCHSKGIVLRGGD